MNASRAAGKLTADLSEFTADELQLILAHWPLWAREDQLPPDRGDGDAWRVWLILGGRGAGKTRAGAEWITAKALGRSPDGSPAAQRIALVGETLGDVRRVMIEGISGLLNVGAPNERPDFEPSKGQLTFASGAIAQMFSAEDPDGLRGPQFDAAWCDAFVGACLERSGHASTRSLMARSYLRWGEKLEEARFGAIAVLSRGSDPAAGHVGFFIGETQSHVVLLGGNQGDAVAVAAFPKTRLLGVRWPQIAMPSASMGEPRDAGPLFARALEHVLEVEGGFDDDPFDPGGPTNKGITLGVFAEWKGVTRSSALKEELKRIPDDTVRDIYRQRYWQPAHCEEMAAALAFFHFDAAVNHGVTGAMRLLQRAVGTDADGEIGPNTRAAIEQLSIDDALRRYAEVRRARYRALPHFWRFGRGWLARVDTALARALEIVGERPKDETTSIATNREGTPMSETTTETETTGKWWGQSITIWGAVITGLSTVLPALGPVIGIDITGDLVRQLGDGIVQTVQAVGGLIGTLMTVYGRVRASTPLAQRNVQLKL